MTWMPAHEQATSQRRDGARSVQKKMQYNSVQRMSKLCAEDNESYIGLIWERRVLIKAQPAQNSRSYRNADICTRRDKGQV